MLWRRLGLSHAVGRLWLSACHMEFFDLKSAVPSHLKPCIIKLSSSLTAERHDYCLALDLAHAGEIKLVCMVVYLSTTVRLLL